MLEGRSVREVENPALDLHSSLYLLLPGAGDGTWASGIFGQVLDPPEPQFEPQLCCNREGCFDPLV